MLKPRLRRRKYFERREEPEGTPPGTLLPPKKPPGEKVRITVMDYTPEGYTEFETYKVEECTRYRDSESVTWINIDGTGDVEVLVKLGEYFGVHPLALEDIQDVEQRPKVERYEDFLLIVVKSLDYDKLMMDEQVSILLGTKYVISVTERRSDSFDALRERIRRNRGRVRHMGADYLAYSLLDLITDELFPILEDFGDRLIQIESSIVSNPKPQHLQTILQSKRDLLLLRRSVWPHMEVVRHLKDEETDLIKPGTKRYLRDCYDHTVQVIDTTETYRDVSAGLQDLYMSSISNKMNEVMKVLTVIATIFIPLTFITGVYGMNFANMPELRWEWGYAFVWGVMLLVVAIMIIYFRKKRWI